MSYDSRSQTKHIHYAIGLNNAAFCTNSEALQQFER
jgi:hypothetical protein